MRLFIALELPESVITALQTAQQHLRRSTSHPVKWVAPAGMHLTLRFLGDVEQTDVPAILAALEHIQQTHADAAQASLRLNAVGAFPNLKRPQTIWMGVGGDIPTLNHVQHMLTDTLEPLGFAPETRAFHAHLTLGRVRREATPHQRTLLGNALAALPKPAPQNWTMGRPILFQSTLTPDGAIYRKVSNESL
jgi:2'-5' RNA ligase